MPTKKRKRPAYPKVGSGEDFPARRPGSRVGEAYGGGKIMQPTRATQGRRNKARRRFEATPLPRARPGTRFQAAPYRGTGFKGGNTIGRQRRTYYA